MKPKAANHEVLLFTNSRFSKKQFCTKNCSHAEDLSESQLQNACWNGLVFDILPEIIGYSSHKNGCYTWEVTPAKNFIEVKIGAAPYCPAHETSVNPYFFLFERNFN